MRDYRFNELSADDFEGLVIHVCRVVLGTGTVKFAQGPDGGRDGRFTGTAQRYPSAASPWNGKFIVQAKHTSNPIASCSDAEFAKAQSGTIKSELPRIIKLRENGELDNYLLFTNRRMGGETDAAISALIKGETGIKQCAVIGLETLTGWIEEHPKLIKLCGLDRLLGPLRFHAQDLKEVIETFHKKHIVTKIVSQAKYQFEYRTVEEKNRKNRLGKRYFEVMKDSSEPYFAQIRTFLVDPVNEDIAEQYHNLADEFNNKVQIRRDQFGAFEEVFEVLYDAVLEEVPSLRTRRRLINVFLHYMYFNCDLGAK